MKYIIEIPDEDRVDFTKNGFIKRIGDRVQISRPISSLVKLDDFLKMLKLTEGKPRNPKPGEEWEYIDDGIKCLVVKKIYRLFDKPTYDVIMRDNGEYFNMSREELIRPTGKTYPEIIKVMEGYVNEANSAE